MILAETHDRRKYDAIFSKSQLTTVYQLEY